MDEQAPRAHPDRLRRVVLKALGLASVGLGLLGAFLPLVPTTPFVLLASVCFARSSPKLDAWLHDHDVLGPPLEAWEEHRALPRRAKIATLVLLWITIPLTMLLLSHTYARVVLLALLFAATLLIGRVPTLEHAKPPTGSGRARPGRP